MTRPSGYACAFALLHIACSGGEEKDRSLPRAACSAEAAKLEVRGHRFIFGRNGERFAVATKADRLRAVGVPCDDAPCHVALSTSTAGGGKPPPAWLPSLPGLSQRSATVSIDATSDRPACGRLTLPVWVATDPDELPVLESSGPKASVDDLDRRLRTAALWDRLWLLLKKARRLARRGKSVAAAESYEEGARAAAQLHLSSEQSRRLAGASFVWRRSGRFELARKRATESRDIADSIGSRILRSRADYALGLVLRQSGDLLGAARRFEAARDGADSGPLLDQIAPTLELSVIRAHLGQHGRALRYLEALEGVDRSGLDEAYRAQIDTNIGIVKGLALQAGALEVGPEDYLQHYEGKPRFWRRRGDLVQELWARYQLAQAYSRVGRPEEADEELRRLEARPSSERFGAQGVLQLRGEIALTLGRDEEALAHFRRSFRVASERALFGASEWTWKAWYGRAKIYVRRGEADRAAEAYTRALDHRRRAAALTSIQDGRMTFLADRSRVVTDAAALALEQGRVLDAVLLWDRERATVLSALDAQARRARLVPEDDAKLLERISDFRAARSAYEARRQRVSSRELSVQERRAASRELARARAELKYKFEALFALLDRRGASSDTHHEPEDLRRALAADEALLYEIPIDPSAAGIAWVDPTGARRVDLDELAAVTASAAASGLSHLYVVARPGPFSALAGDERLLRHVSVSRLPYAGLLATPPGPKGEGALVVLDPQGDLPFAREEARVLPTHLEPRTTLMGNEASRRSVLEELEGKALFHFAGHGELAAASPWDAHLKLAEGLRLTLADVLAYGVGADLVVLNGCETGGRAGPVQLFALGLAEAFLVGGTRAIVATDRPVRDREAARFIGLFYEAGGAERPAEAFRRAMLAARKEGLAAADAFHLVGRRGIRTVSPGWGQAQGG